MDNRDQLAQVKATRKQRLERGLRDTQANSHYSTVMSEQIPSAPGPSTPLTASYTYHSTTPTAPGPYILGVDEAGRRPVLGPLVYGIAYCPAAYQEQMEELGFAGRERVRLLQELSIFFNPS